MKTTKFSKLFSFNSKKNLTKRMMDLLVMYKNEKDTPHMTQTDIPDDVVRQINDVQRNICKQQGENSPFITVPMLIAVIVKSVLEEHEDDLLNIQALYNKHLQQKSYATYLLMHHEKEIDEIQKNRQNEINQLKNSIQSQLDTQKDELTQEFDRQLKQKETLLQSLMAENKSLKRTNNELLEKMPQHKNDNNQQKPPQKKGS